jgi:hypothetical protein
MPPGELRFVLVTVGRLLETPAAELALAVLPALVVPLVVPLVAPLVAPVVAPVVAELLFAALVFVELAFAAVFALLLAPELALSATEQPPASADDASRNRAQSKVLWGMRSYLLTREGVGARFAVWTGASGVARLCPPQRADGKR